MHDPVADYISRLQSTGFSSFDLLSGRTLGEKLIDLNLSGAPSGPSAIVAGLSNLAATLGKQDCSNVKIVVFGGGTGLSTIIGGDSLSLSWIENPFQGLKKIFPETRAIVCATDDGGSTGELLKDLPLIGLGDLRHVLLSSVQEQRLCDKYDLSSAAALKVVAALFALFNYRYHYSPSGIAEFMGRGGINFDGLPALLSQSLFDLLQHLFDDQRLQKILVRPHCLGNLLITSAIYQVHESDTLDAPPEAVRKGLNYIADLLGVGPNAVLPCTTTPSMLKLCYANGVEVTGESKSGHARRGYPVDQVVVDFSHPEPHVLPEVLESIEQADIIIFAPGSLYTSIVPILQVPGLASAVRANQSALKMLVANLWVQQGETDLAMDNPDRRFYVSDLVRAYHRNIPGGISGLFQKILLLGMQDIPGSILQSYAVEDKEPIYLDRNQVGKLGFTPIEARIYSQEALLDRRVKHDPQSFASAVKTMWLVRNLVGEEPDSVPQLPLVTEIKTSSCVEIPCNRYKSILAILEERRIKPSSWLADILWRHWDIPLRHLENVKGVQLIEEKEWKRCQQWDNVYSFFDPEDGLLKIRKDMLSKERFEVLLLVALGQSLLGNYAQRKELLPLEVAGESVGKIFNLYLRSDEQCRCYLKDTDLRTYLTLARMRQKSADKHHFTRVMNADEGFTPPGLLFGLTYAWYLDNRFAPHIEYKMSIAKTPVSNMVPEQIRTLGRRQALVDFFRTVVFG